MTDTQSVSPDPSTARVYTAVWCFISAALLLCIGVLTAFGQPEWRHSTVWLPMSFTIASALPFIVVGLILRAGTVAWPLGAASGLAWFTILASLALTLIGFVFGLLVLTGLGAVFPPIVWIAEAATDLHENMPSGGYFLITGLFVCAIAIVHEAGRARRMDVVASGKRTQWTGARLAAFSYGVVGWILLANVYHAELERSTRQGEAREKEYGEFVANVRRTLRRAQYCLVDYARKHPGEGYPDSLSAVGPSGTGCFDSTKFRAELAGAQMRYLRTRSDSASRIDGFWAVIEPVSKAAAWRNLYYANDSGKMYWARDISRDDALEVDGYITTPPLPMAKIESGLVDSPVRSLLAVSNCLRRLYHRANAEFPSSIDNHPCTNIPMMPRAAGNQLALTVASHYTSSVGGTYLVVYHPQRDAPDGPVVGFAIEARPRVYGVDGLRSYLVDNEEKIHWTRDDRPPSMADPILKSE